MKRWFFGGVLAISILAVVGYLLIPPADKEKEPAASGMTAAERSTRAVRLALLRKHLLPALAKVDVSSLRSIRVRGLVVSFNNGEPIPNAEVVFGDDGKIFTTRSNSYGSYLIDLRSGEYLVYAKQEGYLALDGGNSTQTIERPTNHMDIELHEAATITGRVVDKAGTPIKGVTVVGNAKPLEGSKTMSLKGVDLDSTDHTGKFRICVPTTRVQLRIAHSAFGGWTDVPNVIFYLERGDTEEVEIRIVNGVTLHGNLRLSDASA